MLERHQIFDLMGQLKLAGMRHAYDEVIADGIKRQHRSARPNMSLPILAATPTGTPSPTVAWSVPTRPA